MREKGEWVNTEVFLRGVPALDNSSVSSNVLISCKSSQRSGEIAAPARIK